MKGIETHREANKLANIANAVAHREYADWAKAIRRPGDGQFSVRLLVSTAVFAATREANQGCRHRRGAWEGGS